MNYSRPVIAGSILTVVALVLVLLVKLSPEAVPEAGPRDPSAAANGPAAANPPSRDTKYSRPDRTRAPSESPDAKALKLLWARGRAQELLVALDQLSEHADAEDWQAVSEVLQEQAAKDGRHEVATYLLATGHGAPSAIRLAIYAAALDNPDDGIKDSAKLELLNLTGEDFATSAEAKAWIAAHPEASREEEEDPMEE